MSEMVGPGFDLPDEILSVIPMDPYEQLDLARKITSMAIASRVSNLESETHKLRQTLKAKDGLISQLEDRVLRIDQAFHDAELQLKAITDDNTKLSRERDSLAATARKLSRDLAKLKTFKRQLMQSLNDDDPSPAETVDIETYDQSNPKHNSIKEEVNGYATHNSYRGSFESRNNMDDAFKKTGQRFSITPNITPRLTPTTTPKIISTNGSPRRYSAAESPQTASGATSPTKAKYAMSSWYSSSQQSSATNSPPHGRSVTARAPHIDGKEFFRQARSRLTHEQFSAFLANIKELNAQKQSREETLRKAEEIFGTDNKDLYLSFQGLLNRNVH